MSWWSEWIFAVLIASGILLIFKDGVVLTILIWVIYLLNGYKTVKAIPSDENKSELVTHTIIGVLVNLFSIGFKLWVSGGWAAILGVIGSIFAVILVLYLKKKRILQKIKLFIKKHKKTIVISTSISFLSVTFIVLSIFVIIPNSQYNDAVSLMESGQYEDAIVAFEAMDGYKDSKQQIKNCETAIKEIAYKKAEQTYTNKNYEQAYSLFYELLGYKDSLDRAHESASQVGKEALAKKNYEKAIEWYSKAGKSDDVKNVKYQYVLSHRNNDDETTFSYLSDLRKANYKNSGEIFSELYSWKIEFVAANSDPNSTQNKTTISKYDPVYIHFRLTGGTPNGSIKPYVKFTLPNGKTGTYEWDYTCKDGDSLWYGWAEGIYTNPQYGQEGTLTVTFYPYGYISIYDPIGTITVTIGS